MLNVLPPFELQRSPATRAKKFCGGPSLGAAKALIASGRLAQIGDTELRLGLAGLEDRVRDAREEEQEARKVVTDHILPMLGRRTDLAPFARVDAGLITTAGSPTGSRPIESSQDQGMRSNGDFEFPNDLDLRNAVRLRLIWLGNALNEFERLDIRMAELVALLALEID